jgi:aspartyl-tRNA synthetase
MNSIKNSEKFNSLVKELTSRLFRKKMNEMTTTASIDGFETPNAFKKKKKEKPKNFVGEEVSREDMETIKKQIRREVSDIIFKIWLKRTSWGGK